MKKKKKKSFRDRSIFRHHNQIQDKRGFISPVRHLDKYSLEGTDYMCDECRIMGFCKVKNPGRYFDFVEGYPTKKDSDTRLISYDISRLADLIELNKLGSRKGLFSTKNIQLASEAFHSGEYDTAHYYFSLVAEENRADEEALLGMAISLFYLERYEESVDALQKCNEALLPEGMDEAFVDAAKLRQKLKDIAQTVSDEERVSAGGYQQMV